MKIDVLLNPQMRKTWVTEKHMIAFALRPQDPKGPTVDVLIDPRIDVAESLKRAETKIIEGVRVPLAAVGDMISLKRSTGRTQDEADIEQLEKLLKQRK